MQHPAAAGFPTEVGLRKELRKLLDEFLPLCEQLDALCVDHFPALLKRFGQGWNLISKQNLVLAEVPATALLQSLDDHLSEPSVGAAKRAVIHQRLEAARKLVTPEEVASQRQRESLKELYTQRAHRIATGADTTELDVQIRDIKRAQRRSPQLQEDEVLGERYQLLSLLGKGGFARVYQALDLWTHSLVAIKVLHSESSDEPRMLERFYRGARNMQALHHAHIVRILEAPSQHDGFHYFVMEYLPKGDLQRAIRKRQVELSPQDKLRLLLEVADAIQFAHERGLIHRDVKPENILLDQNNHAYLSDFDLVQAADSTGGTRSHAALGTFLYAAPEQFIDASQVTTAADVFGFGMLTAFVVYGAALPFWVPSNRGLFLRNLDAPAPIIGALERCLHNDPAERPALPALCDDLRLYWIPRRSEDATAIPKVILTSAELLGEVVTGVAGDFVSSSEVAQPAISAASSGSPLPVEVMLPRTRLSKWRWRVLAVTILGVLGVSSTLSKSRLASRLVFDMKEAAPQPSQSIRMVSEERRQTEPDQQPQASLEPDMATVSREDLEPAAPRVRPVNRRVKTARQQPKATALPSQPNAMELSSEYVEQELHQAQTELVNGNFTDAIAKAMAVQRGNPNFAWRITGAAACQIKDVKLASESLKHLDSSGRQYMVYACQRQHIIVSNGHFMLAEPLPSSP